MNQNQPDIFDRMKAGGLIPQNDPQYPKVIEVVNRAIELSSVSGPT